MTTAPDATASASDAQRRAERAADAMLRDDSASRHAEVVLDRVAPGFARCRMTISERHANGHGICHGGFIFLLADTAFAVACNSGNLRTVAQHAEISFLRPGVLGDVLIAEARETSVVGRSGVYDVSVSSESSGERIAEFRGLSRRIAGTLFDEAAAGEEERSS